MFDICDLKIRDLAIKAARLLRKEKGLPEEKNITTLYEEIAPLLGLPPSKISSQQINHLPAPHEMINTDTGKFIVPRKDCPSCGNKESMNLHPICQSCEDAEGGKYNSMWKCEKCQFKDKSTKYFLQWMNEMGIDIGGMKNKLGIKTVTDEGLK